MHTEALRSQLNSLKHQIELVKKVHEADLKTTKADYDRKVELMIKEKNYSMSLQREKISDLQTSIKEERERSEILKEELAQVSSQCQQDIISFESKKKILLDDIKMLKGEQSLQRSNIQLLQNELKVLETEYEQSGMYLLSKYESNCSTLATLSISNQNKIKALEHEIEELRKILRNKDSTSDEDIKTLEEALRSTYHTIELQTFSIDKLRKAAEQSFKDIENNEKNTKILEHQEKTLSEENATLKDAIDKLERRIYGRSNRLNN
jgi:DNA repair exonuclease SbcCD ATPase subunit